jgi:hypothetical protein
MLSRQQNSVLSKAIQSAHAEPMRVAKLLIGEAETTHHLAPPAIRWSAVMTAPSPETGKAKSQQAGNQRVADQKDGHGASKSIFPMRAWPTVHARDLLEPPAKACSRDPTTTVRMRSLWGPLDAWKRVPLRAAGEKCPRLIFCKREQEQQTNQYVNKLHDSRSSSSIGVRLGRETAKGSSGW